MTAHGPQPLNGYVMRDYERAHAMLRRTWLTRGPSQEELAERVGTSKGSIQHWLAGRREPLASSLFALAEALGYDVALIPIPREDA